MVKSNYMNKQTYMEMYLCPQKFTDSPHILFKPEMITMKMKEFRVKADFNTS